MAVICIYIFKEGVPALQNWQRKAKLLQYPEGPYLLYPPFKGLYPSFFNGTKHRGLQPASPQHAPGRLVPLCPVWQEMWGSASRFSL